MDARILLPRAPLQLLGIDGCRAGWVIARSDPSLSCLDLAIVSTLDTTFDDARDGRALIAIDVPIGLPSSGPRACDLAARRRLSGPRKSSVFPAPCRATLGATTYAEACRINAAVCGKRVAIQLFNILPKIRDVDRLLTPALQRRVREAHPEVIFSVLAGAAGGSLPPKRERGGHLERLRLLGRFFPSCDASAIRDHSAGLAARWGSRAVAADDLVDALACLVTAHRASTGQVAVLPGEPVPCDERGLRMEILA